MSDIGDNRLAVLSSEIRTNHAGVKAAAEAAAAHAIAAGQALIEAKALVGHGQWLPWLEKHCDLSERTAQLYMRIAEKGMDAAIVAALGLKGAASAFEIHDPGYNPFAGCDAERKRQWLLFACFIGSWTHTEWVIQKQFVSPDEWLGPVGEAQRRFWGLRSVSDECRAKWARYREENHEASEQDLSERLGDTESAAAAEAQPRRRKGRRKSATVADLARMPSQPKPALSSEQMKLSMSLRLLSEQTDPELQRRGLARLAAKFGGRA